MTEPMTTQPEHLQARRKPHLGLRADFKQRERLRAHSSLTLAEEYPHLKKLSVELTFRNGRNGGKSNTIKYSANVAHAKSVFRFDCPNGECIEGDFDLSELLTEAYAERQTEVSGESRCEGWRDRSAVGTSQCQQTLSFRLMLGYDD